MSIKMKENVKKRRSQDSRRNQDWGNVARFVSSDRKSNGNCFFWSSSRAFAPSLLCVLFIAILSSATLGCAIAQSSAPLTKESSVDEILDALDARGKNLKSFVCDVRLTQLDPQMGIAPVDIGRVFYQLKGNGDGRIYVKFTQSIPDEGQQPVAKMVEYLLDDGRLTDRDHKRRSQSSHEILKPGEKLNLLKLGEGPFPLPIGQPKEDVQKMFDVTRIDASPDDPADTVHLRLIPKPDTRFARQFNSLDTFVDLKQHMPVRIATVKKGESERTADLSNVQINPDLTDRDFELVKVDLSGWNKSEGASPDESGASNAGRK